LSGSGGYEPEKGENTLLYELKAEWSLRCFACPTRLAQVALDGQERATHELGKKKSHGMENGGWSKSEAVVSG